MNTPVFVCESVDDYTLIDSGDGEKLERFGKITVARPDPQALWAKSASSTEWLKADFRFDTQTESGKSRGSWISAKGAPSEWVISFADLKFVIKPAAFKHVGIFPEQFSNWQWSQEKIKERSKSGEVSVLNLFGYTGGASLAAAKGGAKVTHVDASKTSVSIARKNAIASGLENAPIRWIVDDAVAFVKREIRRGQKYDAIIMDPPVFGRGPEGQVWKIEEDLMKLLASTKELLSEKPLFVVVNGYAAGYSAIAYKNALESIFGLNQGLIEHGELSIRDNAKRLLPAGIFARISF